MEIIFWLFAVLLGYFVGGARERKHIKDIQTREAQLLQHIPTRADRGPKLTSGETFLVCSSVVVASDAFKDFAGRLRGFFGGRVRSHETLIDRARREAVLRVRERALQYGGTSIVDMHVQTSFIDQMGVEVSAYGTAIRHA